MWRTSEGERVLEGAERALFLEALGALWDDVEMAIDADDDILAVGIEAFDSLQPGQKLAALADVGEALTDPAVPCPPLLAYNEATAAAAYRRAYLGIEEEIDLARGPDRGHDTEGLDTGEWRRLARAAHLERHPGDADRAMPVAEDEGEDEDDGGDGPWPPELESEDVEGWGDLIEGLSDRVLWDADYEAGGEVLDAAPGPRRRYLDLNRIDDRYYSAAAPDPGDAELGGVRGRLRRLCGRPEPDPPIPLDGLLDAHNDLFVGPCGPSQVGPFEGCRLVHEIRFEPDDPGDDPFDLTFAEWDGPLRAAAVAASAEPFRPARPEDVLSPAELEAAEGAQATRRPLPAAGGHRVEFVAGAWCVACDRGSYLASVEDPFYTSAGQEAGTPRLKYLTAAEALAAAAQAGAISEARRARREAALIALGREP